MSCKRNQDGFTLVEVMVAVLLLGIVLVPFMGALTDGIQLLYRGRDRVIAAYLLQQRAEEIKAAGYDNLPAGETAYPNYSGSAWTLKQNVSTVTSMPGQGGSAVVKKVTLELDKNSNMVDSLTFLLYKGGI
ncbi:type II secretion system protein [Moorella naiadis]|uniref:type IV pilus modification PilV family protein n=1 Tax=Moorella naiadis (nom. illeg.) TaxID=3093670 RepID=UPI003D9CA7B9